VEGQGLTADVDPIDGLLEGELLGRSFDCECGASHHVPTRLVRCGRGALDTVPETAAELCGAASALVVADVRTWRVAGDQVYRGLRSAGRAERRIVPDGSDGPPHASVDLVDELEAVTPDRFDLYVAVGSGTVNDLTKELAGRRGRPYVAVATAASMNGYTSSIVALLEGGLKTTRPAPPPLAVVADSEVLSAAPLELTLAGLGDLVSKPFCGCDWWLASVVRGDTYCPLPARILDQAFDGALEVFPRLAGRDPDAVLLLAKLLIVSGMTMTIAGSSAPASGGEHLLSHFWDMTRLRDGRAIGLHGAQVGVASVAMNALYERVLEHGLEGASFEAADVDETELERVFGDLTGAVRPQYRAKLASRSARDVEVLDQRRPDVERAIAEVLASGKKVRSALAGSGAPITAGAIGVGRSELASALRYGRWVRNRYTILDLAADLGVLDGFAADYPDREIGWFA